MAPVRVILADDHALLRAGIRSLLHGLKEIEVVAEASNGLEALKLIKAHHPDVLCTDIGMAGMNGLVLTGRVVKEFPRVRVIILSMHASEEYVCQALRLGAAGYLLKDSAPSELSFAIKAAARGETYLTPSISKHVINNYVQRTGGESSPLELLTLRQREILQLVAEGRTTKEIARTLHIGIKTVETHRTQLMDRLDIHDLAGLVRFAIRVGLVQPEA
jgi:DNA-binding NarL/FixJ family response regulator